MDHIDRVLASIEYIETHLSDPVRLETVARQANSSLFWLHRIFSCAVGDSLGEYVRKRRLQCAAEDLVTSTDRIIDIALRYGFTSHEAFTRSFRKFFGINPKVYRKSKLITSGKEAIPEGVLRYERKFKGDSMISDISKTGIRIVELPPCKMISSIGFSLDEFNKWWSSEDKKRPDRFYPRDFMYYDAGRQELIWWYAYSSSEGYTGKFEQLDFPGGNYAVTNYRDGDDVDGMRAYTDLKGWVETTGYFQIDETHNRPVLFHVTTSDSAFERMKYRQLDLYLPIK